MLNREQIYKELYKSKFDLVNKVVGLSEDKSSRIANIYAVKNTDKEFYRRLKNAK